MEPPLFSILGPKFSSSEKRLKRAWIELSTSYRLPSNELKLDRNKRRKFVFKVGCLSGWCKRLLDGIRLQLMAPSNWLMYLTMRECFGRGNSDELPVPTRRSLPRRRKKIPTKKKLFESAARVTTSNGCADSLTPEGNAVAMFNRLDNLGLKRPLDPQSRTSFAYLIDFCFNWKRLNWIHSKAN